MVKGLPSIEKPASSYDNCIFGKKHREKFIYGVSYRAKAPSELVHTDLCGLMQTPSLTGNVYFMTFIDDFSRKTWVSLLKQKSQALF